MSLLNLLGQSRLLQQQGAQMPFPGMNNFQLQSMNMALQQQQQQQVPQQPQQPKGIVSDKPYVCDICGRGYSYLASLEQHKACHRADHQHQCQGCGRLFKTKDELEKHKLTHNTDGNETRPHQCETCGRRFTLLENLHRHQMIHTDERPFGCHYCHKRFRLAQHLKEHIRIHTGEKPYKCNVCGRAFCQISNLKSHQKTHTKVKAFECDICHKTFRRSFTLKQHKLIHERENITKPVETVELIKKENETLPAYAGLPFVGQEAEQDEQDVEIEVCDDHPSELNSCGNSDHGNSCGEGDSTAQAHSDSGHGSPNHKSLENSSEEEAINSGSDDSGAIVEKEKRPKFYRPFEVDDSPVYTSSKRNRDNHTLPIDITQTKRVRDTNGKIIVYPGIRDNARINPTSALDELRQAAGGAAHWENLRSDREFLWRRLGRGQENVPVPQPVSSVNSVNGAGDSDMVPVVEWRPVVVGYRSLKDGSVTNRAHENAEQLMKHSLFNPMGFPQQQ
jgi:hypothetical protein